MRYLKRILLSVGLILTSMSLLAACNTIKGTAEGAGQDIQAASNAISAPEHKKTHKHKHKHKHAKVIKKNTNDSSIQENQEGPAQTNKSY